MLLQEELKCKLSTNISNKIRLHSHKIANNGHNDITNMLEKRHLGHEP